MAGDLGCMRFGSKRVLLMLLGWEFRRVPKKTFKRAIAKCFMFR